MYEPYVSVVIPVYNEEESVTGCVLELARVLNDLGRPWEVIIADDGSVDKTSERLHELRGAVGQLGVVRLARRGGQSLALSAAIERSRGDVVAVLDGDGQDDPRELPGLLARLEAPCDGGIPLDAVVGWRVERQDGRWRRRLPSRAANWLVGQGTGLPYRDYGCALKVVRRPCLEGLLPLGKGHHRFLAAWLVLSGFRVEEAAVRHRARQAGVSKYGFGRTAEVLLDALCLYVLFRGLRQPLRFFGRWSAAGFAVAGVSLFAASVLRLVHGIHYDATPLPLLAGVSSLLAVTSLFSGLILEVLAWSSKGRGPAVPVASFVEPENVGTIGQKDSSPGR